MTKPKVAFNIEWETDGNDVDLPLMVKIPPKITRGIAKQDELEEVIADYLSEEYGWLVKSFCIH
jgi:hypothetical protein